MSDTQIVETPETTPGGNAETPPVNSGAPETNKETFDQTLERVAREVETGTRRGEGGKFESRVAAPGAPETAKVPGSPQAAPPDPAPQVIEAPQSLPADVKAKWATLPPEHQQWLAKREGEIHQKFTTDGERLKTLSAFEEVLKPIEPRLQQLGAPAPEYFRRLAAADQLLSANGVEGIRQIAQMYGIDLHAALQNGNQPGVQPTPQAPNVEALVDQRVQKILLEQRVAEKSGEIEKFKAALTTDEQPDFDTLQPVMANLAQANPKWSLEQLYKAARRADETTYAKDQAKAQADAQKKAEEEAKKRAGQDARLAPLSKRPGSAPTGPIKGKTMWDTMDKVAADVLARQ